MFAQQNVHKLRAAEREGRSDGYRPAVAQLLEIKEAGTRRLRVSMVADQISVLKEAATRNAAISEAAAQLGRCGIRNNPQPYPVDENNALINSMEGDARTPSRFRIDFDIAGAG